MDDTRYKPGAIVTAKDDIRGDLYIPQGRKGTILERVGLSEVLVEWPSGKMKVSIEDIDISPAPS